MKNTVFIFVMLLCCHIIYAQKATPVKEPPVPCNGNADSLPGRYTDHTNPKYPTSPQGTAQDKAAMLTQLIALEKVEEASRINFTLTGCVARVSFSGGDKNTFGNITHNAYQYQLAAYQNVCHVTEHIVKTVDEYRTVLRVNVNQLPSQNYLLPGGTGEFTLIDKTVRYEIPIDAIQGPNYGNDRQKNPARIAQYLSEVMILANRSSDYKNKHADFLKIINGEGYVENWMSGSQFDKRSPGAYKWVERHYLITKPGIPLLIPVSRKKYLEDLLEYFDIEKANFYYNLAAQVKNIAGSTSDIAKKRMAILEADKAAYPKLYEAKKEKVKQLLATQKAEWLQQLAVVDNYSVTFDANERLANIGKFYDQEGDRSSALYTYNPEYLKLKADKPVAPMLLEVAFRYEGGDGRGFSERLFKNFLENYNMNKLRKMIE